MKINNQQLEESFLTINTFDEYMEYYEKYIRLENTPAIFAHLMKLLETDEKYTHRKKDQMIIQKRNQLKKYYLEKIEECIKDIECNGYYDLKDLEEEELEVVYFYPKGKKEAVINKYIHELGKVVENNENSYLARIHPKYYKEISTMFFEWDSYSKRKEEGNIELKDYLIKHNRMKRLDEYIYAIQPYSDDFRSIRSIPYKEVKKVIQDYNKLIRNKRDTIYQELLVQKEESGKWKSEQEVFLIVHEHYPDAIFQYQPDFLEGQSLDIYIPSLNVGIEYQGLQHFEEVEFFGGKDALEYNQRRDRNKKYKCKVKGIKLIYWYYFEPISNEWFEHVIEPQFK